jgi:hypothetical protein
MAAAAVWTWSKEKSGKLPDFCISEIGDRWDAVRPAVHGLTYEHRNELGKQ